MSENEPTCTSCGKPFAEHLGLIETCARRIEGAAYIHQLKQELDEARQKLALAESHRKMIDASMRELAEVNQQLRDKVKSLEITAVVFAQCVLSVRKENADEWMDYAAGAFNDLCEVLGKPDRFQYDGKDRLRKVK